MLSSAAQQDLLNTLQKRFVQHPQRHPKLTWKDVESRLLAATDAVWEALLGMEESGGEPDVVCLEDNSSDLLFIDCAAESPKGRRSVCYDPQALESRKENKPQDSALGLAERLGIRLLNESEYRQLQAFGPFDAKTSSWLATPPDIRAKGGAIFGDWRYGHTFIYHNGAESYYAARGFRGLLRV
ncbi:DUF4256 domain-containing protein [Cytophagales bacterium LB-30]|uniref:DUF4256 domain-containing protein n=1 Tax=Shiella aurantiaca TaxID=3058365 RepID=A0ABT8F499_9BACT|nr:DUF4256 domain-containing protein [Shiella aurantiaca]MDN4165069.1 DUF4256 domain-containing protein [Shiella aurantiaca]